VTRYEKVVITTAIAVAVAAILVAAATLVKRHRAPEARGEILFRKELMDPTPAQPYAAPSHIPAGFHAKEGTPAEPYSDTGWAEEIVHDKTGIEMVFIPAGEFRRVVPDDADSTSLNVRRYTEHIETPFYLGKYEVTQEQWVGIAGTNPSMYEGDRNPVEMVTWDDCQSFVEKARDGLRLPTEAEWEYACRAGTESWYFFRGNEQYSLMPYEEDLGKYAWYEHNSGVGAGQTHPVGEKLPNPWGLYDMYGNVDEFCQGYFYGKDNPEKLRVMRGGSIYSAARQCTSSYRAAWRSGKAYNTDGLRVARTAAFLNPQVDSSEPSSERRSGEEE